MPGIIENSYRSELVIKNSLFENNDYGEINNPAPIGYAIRSFGPLVIEDSCFNDNTFMKDGPVIVYGANYNATNNYAPTNTTEGLSCSFLAVFYSLHGMTGEETPECVEPDVDTCQVNLRPTPAPSMGPTPAPTRSGKGSSSPQSSAPRISRGMCLSTGLLSLLLAFLM